LDSLSTSLQTLTGPSTQSGATALTISKWNEVNRTRALWI
jgi:hypothetical protein